MIDVTPWVDSWKQYSELKNGGLEIHQVDGAFPTVCAYAGAAFFAVALLAVVLVPLFSARQSTGSDENTEVTGHANERQPKLASRKTLIVVAIFGLILALLPSIHWRAPENVAQPVTFTQYVEQETGVQNLKCTYESQFLGSTTIQNVFAEADEGTVPLVKQPVSCTFTKDGVLQEGKYFSSADGDQVALTDADGQPVLAGKEN